MAGAAGASKTRAVGPAGAEAVPAPAGAGAAAPAGGIDSAQARRPCADRAAAGAGRREAFRAGLADGAPIALGYVAVSLSLGVMAGASGLTPLQALVVGLLCNASAGEYAGFAAAATGAGLLETFGVMLVANARYPLMSCSLAQRFDRRTPLAQRLAVAYDLTDELFGIAMARPGAIDPWYSFGAMTLALPAWALSSFAGALLGGVLPARVLAALSVALFGMFIAIVVPPARHDGRIRTVALASALASCALAWAPVTGALSEGTRTIVLTVLIAAAAAWVAPLDGAEEGLPEPDGDARAEGACATPDGAAAGGRAAGTSPARAARGARGDA